jgi:hypothetical protein
MQLTIIIICFFFYFYQLKMIATSCLFFACKVEEQPRRLREFIDTIHRILHKVNEPLNPQSEVSLRLLSIFMPLILYFL